MPLVTHSPPRRPAPRRGSALVEAAFVLPIFLLFTFGIYEYGRYLMVIQITGNAARDAARWAAVHANDRRTADSSVPGIPTADYTDFYLATDARLTAPAPGGQQPYYRNAPYGATRPAYTVPFVDTYARIRMGPVAGMMENTKVWVFPADSTANGLYANPAKVLPKIGSASWKQAAFTERIAVQIVGNYRPVVPTFLFLPDPIRVSVVGLAPSEG